jgi:hypothetical protein
LELGIEVWEWIFSHAGWGDGRGKLGFLMVTVQGWLIVTGDAGMEGRSDHGEDRELSQRSAFDGLRRARSEVEEAGGVNGYRLDESVGA